MKEAQDLVRLAKSLMAYDDIRVSIFSFEGGKPYSEGGYFYSDDSSALRAAHRYLDEGYDVVVCQGDTLIGFSENFDTLSAMKYGTGTINRLTKQRSRVMRLASSKVAWDSRFNFPRSSYIPKDAPDLKQLDTGKDIGLEIWTYSDGKGRMYGIAFAGKANKPLWHYSFRNQQQLDKQVQETIEDRKGHVDTMQQRRQERLEYKHTLKVDDILVAKWGYDQTNATWFQVIDVGDKSVKVREIAGKQVADDKEVASPGHFTGPVMTKLVGQGDSIRMSSYASAYKWDGKPTYVTPFGMGH